MEHYCAFHAPRVPSRGRWQLVDRDGCDICEISAIQIQKLNISIDHALVAAGGYSVEDPTNGGCALV